MDTIEFTAKLNKLQAENKARFQAMEKKDRLRALEKQQLEGEYIYIYGPDQVVTSSDVEILNISVGKAKDGSRYRSRRRLTIDFKASEGSNVEVYDCQSDPAIGCGGSRAPPRRLHATTKLPDGTYRVDGCTRGGGTLFDTLEEEICEMNDLHHSINKDLTYVSSYVRGMSDDIAAISSDARAMNNEAELMRMEMKGMFGRLESKFDESFGGLEREISEFRNEMHEQFEEMKDWLREAIERQEKAKGEREIVAQ